MERKFTGVAVEDAPETSFKPYIPASAKLPELTALPLII